MSEFSQTPYCILKYPVRFLLFFAHPVFRVKGRENLPEGPVLLCANHVAFTDPIWIVLAGKFRRIPRTMAKIEIMRVPIVGAVLRSLGGFAVNREISDINAVKTAMRILREGDKVLIFPEGTRIRKGKSAKPHGGAIVLSNRTQTPLVPVYITRNRRFLAPMEIEFGKPYLPHADGRRVSEEDAERLAAELMDKVYAMGAKS